MDFPSYFWNGEAWEHCLVESLSPPLGGVKVLPVLIKSSIIRNRLMEDCLRIIPVYFSISKFYSWVLLSFHKGPHILRGAFPWLFIKLFLMNWILAISSAYIRRTTNFSPERLIFVFTIGILLKMPVTPERSFYLWEARRENFLTTAQWEQWLAWFLGHPFSSLSGESSIYEGIR